MHPLAVFTLLVTLMLVIGALAIAGVRKARSMSREHLDKLTQSGQTDRIARPKTRQDFFLRPMSFKDIALGLIGAVILTSAGRAVQSWLGW